MILEIMLIFIGKILDALFPVGGSVGGGFIVLHNQQYGDYLMMMTIFQFLDALIIIIAGAVIGYLVKKGLDWVWKKCKLKK